ncbi:hypothetical protein HYDPIDRAFT_27662 [Hydnomerulius pinastri MD-312]|nr:hypothetical protein HYDPIDRAFT_27662 [Hydnomerulius pinastri MD-312]
MSTFDFMPPPTQSSTSSSDFQSHLLVTDRTDLELSGSGWDDGSAEANQAALIEALRNAHNSFEPDVFVAKRVRDSWSGPTLCPRIEKVFKVIPHPSTTAQYEAYRASKAGHGSKSQVKGLHDGEEFLWHGCEWKCNLGVDSNAFCSSTECHICSVFTTSRQFLAGSDKWAPKVGRHSTLRASFTPVGIVAERWKMILNRAFVGNWCELKSVGSIPPDTFALHDSVSSVSSYEVMNACQLRFDIQVLFRHSVNESESVHLSRGGGYQLPMEAVLPAYLVTYTVL